VREVADNRPKRWHDSTVAAPSPLPFSGDEGWARGPSSSSCNFWRLPVIAVTEPAIVVIFYRGGMWRVFKDPLALFVGGVTAVIMELAEPRVRAGVWEHTTFRSDPLRRLRRTGLAAMVTVYGAHSVAEPMIARVRRVHDMVAGTTLSGEPYRANDPELLNWVYATAAYGFVQAYHTYETFDLARLSGWRVGFEPTTFRLSVMRRGAALTRQGVFSFFILKGQARLLDRARVGRSDRHRIPVVRQGRSQLATWLVSVTQRSS
jgi:ER-bound oxygenase mpaB/B'/Rubber oxygenase, catalytic domain